MSRKAANQVFLKTLAQSGGVVLIAWGTHAVTGGMVSLPISLIVAMATLLFPSDPDESVATFYTKTVGLPAALVLVAAAACTPDLRSPQSLDHLLATMAKAVVTCPSIFWVTPLVIAAGRAALTEGRP
jgi:hypothetical protein